MDHMKDKAIDELPQGHPAWIAAYAGVVIGGLGVLGWFLIRLFEAAHQEGRFPSLFELLTVENILIGAGLFAVPMIAGLIVVQLVARGRRRRHLIAR